MHLLFTKILKAVSWKDKNKGILIGMHDISGKKCRHTYKNTFNQSD